MSVGRLISTWQDWAARRSVMREFQQDAAVAKEQARFKFRDDMIDALDALLRNDQRRAAHLWTSATGRYPDQALRSSLALNVLIGLRRFDEAEALMAAGQRKHPRDQRFAQGLAEVARARGDHETAAERLAILRKQFPDAMEGYAMGVGVLRDLKRLPEAEALVIQTMARFPGEVLGFMEHGRLADLNQDWEAALKRWDVVRLRFDHLSGYAGGAQAMIKLGRFDEAEALLTSARTRFPTDSAPVVGLAQCAQTRGDTAEAVARWHRLAQRFPLHQPSVYAAAAALEQLGAAEDAEQTLREAADHFREEPRPLHELGALLLRRRDYPGAVEAFAMLRRSFPGNEASYLRGAEALSHAGRPDEAASLRAEHARRFA